MLGVLVAGPAGQARPVGVVQHPRGTLAQASIRNVAVVAPSVRVVERDPIGTAMARSADRIGVGILGVVDRCEILVVSGVHMVARDLRWPSDETRPGIGRARRMVRVVAADACDPVLGLTPYRPGRRLPCVPAARLERRVTTRAEGIMGVAAYSGSVGVGMLHLNQIVGEMALVTR